MESLISKWKAAQNSSKKDRPKSSLGSNAKPQHNYSSSSDSDSSEQKQNVNRNHPYNQTAKSEQHPPYASSTGHVSNKQSIISPPKSSQRKISNDLHEYENSTRTLNNSLKKSGHSHHDRSDKKMTPKRGDIERIDNERSPKQGNQGMKKGVPLLIDQASYKVMDIFKYNNDLSNQEKLQRVRRVIEDVVENTSYKTDELENQINTLRQETKRVTMLSKADPSSKIVGELEARLYESEREKIQMKKEKDQLLNDINTLEKEKDMNGMNVELLYMLRDNQKILEENNNHLVRQLEEGKRREIEQQLIWRKEVEDLSEILKLLKDQLMHQQQEESTE